MEFLKEVLGDELYSQFVEKINAHNGNEANKDKQIKLENINSGNYVSKLKFEDMVNQLSGKDAEIANANNLIAELKKASKGNEDMQKKFADYDVQVAQLQAKLLEAETKHAFEVLLMDAGVKDKDEREFLAFKYEKKLKEEGRTLELDENKHIKGGEGIIDSLKTSNPKPFESAGAGEYKVLGDNRLPEGDVDRKVEPQNLAEALKMQYESK